MPSKSRRKDENQKTPIKYSMIGSFLGVTIYYLLVFICSLLILKFGLGTSAYLYFGLGSGVISGLLCGFLTVKPIKRGAVVYGSLSGSISSVVILSLAFFINSKKFGTMSAVLFGVIFISSVIGGICAVNIKKRRKY